MRQSLVPRAKKDSICQSVGKSRFGMDARDLIRCYQYCYYCDRHAREYTTVKARFPRSLYPKDSITRET